MTDYMQGIGHVPGYKFAFGARPTNDARAQKRELERAAETGTYPKRFRFQNAPMGITRLSAPTLEDVLYSLVSDASARNYTFVDWCAEFGYDTDSRKAKATYDACVEQGIALRSVFGGESNLETLATLFEGY